MVPSWDETRRRCVCEGLILTLPIVLFKLDSSQRRALLLAAGVVAGAACALRCPLRLVCWPRSALLHIRPSPDLISRASAGAAVSV